MAFATHLETLRAKPEHVRRKIAFWTSFGVTALIFVFWLGSFSSAGKPVPPTSAVASAVEKTGSPAQSLIAGVGAFGKDVWSLIFGTKKVTYSEVQVAPGKN